MPTEVSSTSTSNPSTTSASSQSLLDSIVKANEDTWLRIGKVSELMNDQTKALAAYENVLQHNPYNIKALTHVATLYRFKENYAKAIEYFQRILSIDETNGEIWGALGNCYLMTDDLQSAYNSYQKSLFHLQKPKDDPNLWYGIGILYDRYGSYEYAEEAFSAVLKMYPQFEKSNEIYFRLGMVYKQQGMYQQALEYFKHVLTSPPQPLDEADIWFQIGHVYELEQEYSSAKDAYEKVLKRNPKHAKVLQQLGWLYHHNTSFGNQDTAIEYLLSSIDSDPTDGQTWYLLGRCYMTHRKYKKAYEAYQQAVYRDGQNPMSWCSIGVLYYQIGQYRDALDAYSRAIRLNPYLNEVWYGLGALYETCNQPADSLDAYQRAAELNQKNSKVKQRLQHFKQGTNGTVLPKPIGMASMPSGQGQSQGNPPPPLQMPPTSAPSQQMIQMTSQTGSALKPLLSQQQLQHPQPQSHSQQHALQQLQQQQIQHAHQQQIQQAHQQQMHQQQLHHQQMQHHQQLHQQQMQQHHMQQHQFQQQQQQQHQFQQQHTYHQQQLHQQHQLQQQLQQQMQRQQQQQQQMQPGQFQLQKKMILPNAKESPAIGSNMMPPSNPLSRSGEDSMKGGMHNLLLNQRRNPYVSENAQDIQKEQSQSGYHFNLQSIPGSGVKRPSSMNPPWPANASTSVIPSTRMYGKPVPVDSLGGRQMQTLPSAPVSYAKSSLPPQSQHMAVGPSGTPKKLAPPGFEDDKRKFQADSDAAIEGLMSLKSVAQKIPQNDGASSSFDEHPAKRLRLQ